MPRRPRTRRRPGTRRCRSRSRCRGSVRRSIRRRTPPRPRRRGGRAGRTRRGCRRSSCGRRYRGDRHRLDQHVRVVLEDPVVERTRLALVGIGDQVVRLPVVGTITCHLRPIGNDAPPRPCRPDAFTSLVISRGLHFLQCLLKRAVAAARAVFRQRVRGRRDRERLMSWRPGMAIQGPPAACRLLAA